MPSCAAWPDGGWVGQLISLPLPADILSGTTGRCSLRGHMLAANGRFMVAQAGCAAPRSKDAGSLLQDWQQVVLPTVHACMAATGMPTCSLSECRLFTIGTTNHTQQEFAALSSKDGDSGAASQLHPVLVPTSGLHDEQGPLSWALRILCVA